MERVVPSLHKMQRRALAEPLDKGLEQFQVSELVTGALQEEHRNVDPREMLRARITGPPGRMQRKAKEDEPPHAGERLLRLRRRGHASAGRPAARHQGS